MIDEAPVCCVADQLCVAAANFESRPRSIPECFRCGQDVCRMCSTIRKYSRYGNKRLCNDCQIDIDKNDRIILARITRLLK